MDSKGFDWGSFYTIPEEAGIEAKKRFANKELKEEIEKFLSYDLPEPLKVGPKACLGRNVFTPNREFFLFLHEAQKTGLDIFLGEYTEDVFITESPDKYYLGKLFLYNKKGKNGGDRLSVARIIDLNNADRKRISEIRTTWGEPLVDFHRRIFHKTVPDNLVSKCYDMSPWFSRHGGSAKNYYVACLSLFVAHGVFFENYLLELDGEKRFFYEVVIPSIEKVKEYFGYEPIISSIYPSENIFRQLANSWMHYPEFIRKSIGSEEDLQEK